MSNNTKRQIPAPQTPTVSGTIDRVPCPHCGGKNDLRVMREQQLLDTGHCFYCDHCGSSMEVTSIRDVAVVAVRKNPRGGRAGGQRQPVPQQRPQQPQQGGLMAGMRKLLGGPKR